MTLILKNVFWIGEKFLKMSGIERQRNETFLIISKILKKNYLEVLINQEISISEKKKKQILKKIFQRLNGKPISRIFGLKEFYSREFFINSNSLDPRPETETLIDLIKKIELKNSNKRLRILDLGTGTGCIIISLAMELGKFKEVSGVGVDISSGAIDIANRNLMKFNLEDKIEIYRSNWFSEVNGKFDIIVSNPPYVDSNEIEKLDNGVKNFDPYVSLNGGKFGLECFKKISSIAGNFLKKNGYICVELGCGQKKDVQSIFTKNGFHKIIESKDLLNIDRVLVFKNKI